MATEVCVLDAHGHIVAVNLTWRRFARKNNASDPVATGVGLNYLDVTRRAAARDGVARNVLTQLENLLKTGRPFRTRYPCHAPGQKRWYELVGEPLDGSDGERQFLLQHVPVPPLDPEKVGVTPILEALEEGFVALDADQRIVMFNRAAERIFGIGSHEVLGGRLDRFLPTDVRALHRAHVASYHPGGQPRRMAGKSLHVRGLRADGTTVMLAAQISIAQFGGESLHIALLRDMTEQRALEQRERELRGQLERSQRFEALGQLAGGLAHEVNNALAIVLANAELLTSREREATAIGDAARHAAGVVRQLLMFARGTTDEASSCNLCVEARRSVELLRSTLPVALRIELEGPEEDVAVALSEHELRQVLFNLLTNASQAQEGEGQIRIEIRSDGETASLRVEDDGPGVDADIRDRVFEPFVSTKPMTGGSGLGLSVVHGILARRAGSIRLAESQLGGAAFELSLPLALESSPSMLRDEEDLEALDGVRVLVVDDQLSLARALGRMLRSNGLDVSVCGCLADARTRLAEEAFDVLLSDQSLPEGTGLELVREIRSERRDIACAILTGSPSRHLHHQTEELRCAFALKPVDNHDVLRLLRTAIAMQSER